MHPRHYRHYYQQEGGGGTYSDQQSFHRPRHFQPPVHPPLPSSDYSPPPPPPPPPPHDEPLPPPLPHDDIKPLFPDTVSYPQASGATPPPLLNVPTQLQPLFNEPPHLPPYQNRPPSPYSRQRYPPHHYQAPPPFTHGNYESRIDIYNMPQGFSDGSHAPCHNAAGGYYDDRSSLPSWRERSPPDSHPHPPPPSWTGRDERGADHSYSATPPPPPPPHGLLPIPSSFRVESLRKIVPAETIFDMPGRQERPSHITIIIRGLPGSGKSHLAKLMKEKELHYSSSAPRILSIDTYFVNEVEKVEKDPDTGRRVKKKIEEYEYDESLEPSYMSSMLKLFNKTLADGYFSMILVDSVSSKISDFDQFWSNAKLNGFEAFVVELKESVDVCVKRNTHNRTREEIEKLAKQWEPTPPHFLQLDVTSLLSPQDATQIDEVDMEMANSDNEEEETNPPPPPPQSGLVPSRWEQEGMNEDMLDKLDGFKKRRRRGTGGDDEEEEEGEGLSLTEYLERKEVEYNKRGKPKKKRVRWADLEAEKEEMRRKEIGFTLGSGWSKVSEDEVDRILNQTTPTTTNEEEEER